jgi:hypothetical protein
MCVVVEDAGVWNMVIEICLHLKLPSISLVHFHRVGYPDLMGEIRVKLSQRPYDALRVAIELRNSDPSYTARKELPELR